MNVYSRIFVTAKKHGMSIKELARKAQIGENSIYRWKTIKNFLFGPDIIKYEHFNLTYLI